MNKPRSTYSKCPRCAQEYIKRERALCRRDNETDICSSCGVAEALEDAGFTTYKGPIYWKQPPTEGV